MDTQYPKISFVVSLRDPGYGEKYGMDNLYRTQLFVDNLVYLCNKYHLLSELIIVEWNPVKSKEFYQKIKWPAPLDMLKIRWLEVPKKIHQQLENADKIPIFEFFGKNVGIRRAKGEFIISTNPDVLFGEDLIKYLAVRDLALNCFYRIDRLDVAGHISRSWSPERRLCFCSSNVFRQHCFYGSIKPEKVPFYRFWERGRKKRFLIENYWSGKGLIACPDGLHRNASGDFFLMTKDNWFKLRGYAELTTHSHIDSIMCWQAASMNLEQVILDDRLKLYHIDHDRTISQSFPKTNWRYWFEKFKQSLQEGKTLVINDKKWGLAEEYLPEWEIQ